MPGIHEYPEDLLIEVARQRGLALDAERAAALRPLLESLLGRLARFSEILPRDAAPAWPVPESRAVRASREGGPPQPGSARESHLDSAR
jgi:hypothetical protein